MGLLLTYLGLRFPEIITEIRPTALRVVERIKNEPMRNTEHMAVLSEHKLPEVTVTSQYPEGRRDSETVLWMNSESD